MSWMPSGGFNLRVRTGQLGGPVSPLGRREPVAVRSEDYDGLFLTWREQLLLHGPGKSREGVLPPPLLECDMPASKTLEI